jgi:hypothetical protein
MDIKRSDKLKLWLFCGFELNRLQYTDGDYQYQEDDLLWDALPICLDTLYKYAIPKLQDKGYAITLTAFECSGFSANIFDSMALSRESFLKEPTESHADTPTEALYNAIMKVIENERP